MDNEFMDRVLDGSDEVNRIADRIDRFISKTNGRLQKLGLATELYGDVIFDLAGETLILGFGSKIKKFGLWKRETMILFAKDLPAESILALEQVLPLVMTRFFEKNIIVPEELFAPLLNAQRAASMRRNVW